MTPEVNRTITDFRARLRLGGVIAAQAVQEAVTAFQAQDRDLGRTAAALGLSRSTFLRARDAFPTLQAALADVQASAATLGP